MTNIVDIRMHNAAPVLSAEIWRVDQDSNFPRIDLPSLEDALRIEDPVTRELAVDELITRHSELAAGVQLHFYWESDIVDKEGFWAYCDDSGTWVFAEKIEGYEEKPRATRDLHPSKKGRSWEYSFNDYAEVLIVILPPGMGASETNPPAQATIKRGQLMLFFARPGFPDDWTATACLYKVTDATALIKVAGDLNRAFRKNNQAQPPKARSHVLPGDITPKLSPDRALQATLLGVLVACLGLIVAAGALAQGQIKTLGMIFGAVAASISVMWLIGTQILPRHRISTTAGTQVGKK